MVRHFRHATGFCYGTGMLRSRTALAVLLSLLLIVAQQAAGVHMIGHLGEMFARGAGAAHQSASAQPGGERDQDGGGHGGALSSAHACAACVSAAGLAFAAPAQALPPPACGGVHMAPACAPRTAPVAVNPHHYLARAPPAVS